MDSKYNWIVVVIVAFFVLLPTFRRLKKNADNWEKEVQANGAVAGLYCNHISGIERFATMEKCKIFSKDDCIVFTAEASNAKVVLAYNKVISCSVFKKTHPSSRDEIEHFFSVKYDDKGTIKELLFQYDHMPYTFSKTNISDFIQSKLPNNNSVTEL